MADRLGGARCRGPHDSSTFGAPTLCPRRDGASPQDPLLRSPVLTRLGVSGEWGQVA